MTDLPAEQSLNESLADSGASRRSAIISGFQRGALLGIYTSQAIMIPVSIIGFVIVLSRPFDRLEAFGTLTATLSTLGGWFAGLSLAAIYGALAGGLVLGVVRAVRPPPR